MTCDGSDRAARRAARRPPPGRGPDAAAGLARTQTHRRRVGDNSNSSRSATPSHSFTPPTSAAQPRSCSWRAGRVCSAWPRCRPSARRRSSASGASS